MLRTAIKDFFISKRYYLYLYETKEVAESAYPSMACLAIDINGNIICPPPNVNTKYLTKELGSRVSYTMPGEPIFLIKKEKYLLRQATEHCDFWHVIVGEKIGWLCITDIVPDIEQLYENSI